MLIRVPREDRTEAEHAAAVEKVAAGTADVPGIVRVCRAWRVDKTPEATVAAAVELTSRARPARSRCARAAGTSGSRLPPPSWR